jgi:stress-induced morphogen
MSINITRGKTDAIINEIKKVLSSYEKDHPGATIDLYRQNTASVRVRIIDSDFGGMSKRERNDLIWKYLEPASEDSQSDISMLVLLTPDEVNKSVANLEFEDPVPSML